MKNKFIGKKVKILWNDAVLLGPDNWNINLLTKMETSGVVIDFKQNYYIIKNPKTINLKTKKQHPKNKKPKFYAIPVGMIEKIEIKD